ncbi:hypothetical protein [Arthrobacter sp. CAN_C5]|uniref:hypothetical protein n=1 Tax=Arthrobacter sp. CAN_C5 TaxID=2760706 RepID=UPI001AE3819E|nr:hypothetical protein [Arthrobacter sp. CAN_C5]MBP2217687.1 putative membrane protein [Arthrobacter sp. CAN_C5]
MENNLPPSAADQSSSAAALLADVDKDRSALIDRMTTPSWAAPAFGALAAICVVSPAAGDNRSGNSALLIIVGILVVYLYQRATGVRLARIGWAAWLIYAATLVFCLLMLSVSLGLVSFGLLWWVIAPAAAAFGAGALGAHYFMRSAVNRIRSAR